MDIIFNNENAIMSTKRALTVFEENISTTSASGTKDLQETLSKLDDKYKKEIMDYVEQINAFTKRVSSFVDDNIKALEQRSKRITEYDTNSYKKRNIL